MGQLEPTSGRPLHWNDNYIITIHSGPPTLRAFFGDKTIPEYSRIYPVAPYHNTTNPKFSEPA